jgi:hypothetical protein
MHRVSGCVRARAVAALVVHCVFLFGGGVATMGKQEQDSESHARSGPAQEMQASTATQTEPGRRWWLIVVAVVVAAVLVTRLELDSIL